MHPQTTLAIASQHQEALRTQVAADAAADHSGRLAADGAGFDVRQVARYVAAAVLAVAAVVVALAVMDVLAADVANDLLAPKIRWSAPEEFLQMAPKIRYSPPEDFLRTAARIRFG